MIWSLFENRSEEQKLLAWRGAHAERMRYIAWSRVKIARALKAQTRLAAKAIADANPQDQLAHIVEHSLVRSKPLITAVYHRLYLMIAPIFAEKVLASIKASDGQRRSWERIVSDYLSNEGGQKITQINATTRDRIMSIVDEETAKGSSLRDIANRIDSEVVLDQIIMQRAMVIAHTETVSASNWGSLLGARSSGADVVKQWISTRDAATRGLKPTDEFDHWSMDDKTAALDDLFETPKRPGGIEPLQFPGDPSGSAGNIINCLLPGTQMKGLIVGGLKVGYSGSAIEIKTMGGRRLSVTPNHPVLTLRGLVAAKELLESDELICDCPPINSDLLAGVGSENDKGIPTEIEKIVESLFLSHHVLPIMVRSFDLHGDAEFATSDIEIKTSDGKLLLDAESLSPKHLRELIFVSADSEQSSMKSLRSRDLSFERIDSTSSLLPSRSALTFDEFAVGLHPAPFQQFRFGLRPEYDSPLLEMSRQRNAGNSDALRELVHRFAGLVTLDQVAEIRDFKYSGHVYDLQSVSGLNIANDIFVSNCRCTIGYLRKG